MPNYIFKGLPAKRELEKVTKGTTDKEVTKVTATVKPNMVTTKESVTKPVSDLGTFKKGK